MNERCFGRFGEDRCTILECGTCYGNYNTCPFYKPIWMAERDNRWSLNKIAHKPIEVQKQIAEKYFQGQMPWSKGELA